ncbi:MAG: cation:proton antiporter [Candidatus Dormiibacterota bacterium]
MSSLFLELGAVVFALGVLGRLAGLLHLSPIPLYLLAGLAFGRGGVLPLATSHEFLQVGAEIGIVLLLLLLGLEYSAGQLLRNLRAQAPNGLLNIVLNATPGALAALLLHWPPPAILAMAGVTYCASSGIAAKLLEDFGRIGNRETPIVLSLLVLEDLSMAFYLPLLTAVVAGVGLWQGALTEAIAIVAIAVVLVVALRFGSIINRLVFSDDDEVLLLRVLGLALLVAGIASRLEVSDAVGAFLIGIALSGKVAAGARQVLRPLRDLFAALFFVLFGLNTDPAKIPPVLGIAAVLGAVTLVTKIATGWWAARRAGIGIIGQVRAGTEIASRGEFNIVIATLAASTTEDLGPLAATYVLLLAVAGPLLARVAEPLAIRVRRGYLARQGAT